MTETLPTPDVIYLLDMGDEITWCADPEPDYQDRKPTKYIRADHSSKEIERLEKLVYVPGTWKCAKCGCTTICTNLHVNTGGFSANNSPQQCPNKCGPMWRVTERDASNDLADRYVALREQYAPRLTEAEAMEIIGEVIYANRNSRNIAPEVIKALAFAGMRFADDTNVASKTPNRTEG